MPCFVEKNNKKSYQSMNTITYFRSDTR
uniref:Uncharacterized protein n=1 Tax=Lepeophtheirus salmonis TaxID=72036 RepID=A0A0K2SV49_LEPSM